MNDGELYGRTLRCNLAKPMKIKEGSTRPVWATDEWLQKYAGASLATGGGPEGGSMPAPGLEPKEGAKRAADTAEDEPEAKKKRNPQVQFFFWKENEYMILWDKRADCFGDITVHTSVVKP